MFTLLEVAQSIQNTLAQRYTSIFWVKAEMNKLNYYSHSGHCYPELVEKKDGKVIAQLKSTLWKDDYEIINNNFISVLKEPLKEGIKILFAARLSFDPVYGLSLRIIDIDPAYTLGDLEKEKRETIIRLKQENLFDKNKSLKLSLLPQRIAIISVETSKGYADFTKVIAQNPWGYCFFYFLFPSLLQGEKAVDSIIAQLNRIRKVKHHFDVVAIIRGGGGDVGLSCYNSYELSKEIANFPLPVITGIGHATNETVTEMIAHQNAITPTKLAEYLIQQFHNFSVPLNKAIDAVSNKSRLIIYEQKNRLQYTSRYFRSVTQNVLVSNKGIVAKQTASLIYNAVFIFRKNKQEILQTIKMINTGAKNLLNFNANLIIFSKEKLLTSHAQFQKRTATALTNIEKHIAVLDPDNVLKRGYSITRLNGKVIKSQTDVQKNDAIETILFDGIITSNVKSTKKTDKS